VGMARHSPCRCVLEHLTNPMGRLNYELELGSIVYLKTDKEQEERIVTAVNLTLGGGLSYQLTKGEGASYHYEAEITTEQNLVTKLK